MIQQSDPQGFFSAFFNFLWDLASDFFESISSFWPGDGDPPPGGLT